jgi:hypothetical protein
MQNGYALCARTGLDGIAEHLSALSPDQLDILRGQLRIGIHRDVEVTDTEGERRPLVSQAFCSALPVAYTRVPPSHWEAFASLVLEAAYEATMSGQNSVVSLSGLRHIICSVGSVFACVPCANDLTFIGKKKLASQNLSPLIH